MNKTYLNDIFRQAVNDYFGVAAITAEAISKNPDLGLLKPGTPDQLTVNNGVAVTVDGVPLFRAVAKKRRGDMFRSPMEFGQALQGALDAVCYANCLNRLRLVRVNQLPGNYVGLILTWGNW